MEYELYHYGVKGMKWGVRKKRDRPASVRTARKQAKEAGKQAAKDTVNRMNASHKKHTLREYNNAARKAKRQAEMDSFRETKASNKQKRAAKKAAAEAKEREYRKSLNKHYQDDFNYYADKYMYGKRGVERISKDLDKGISSTSAYIRETGRQTVAAMLGSAIGFAAVGAIGLLTDR